MPRPDHACPVVKNIVHLTLQLTIQTACAGTVCSGYWTMCQIRTCFIVRTIVIYLVACSRSLIVLDVGHEVPSCTYITAVRKGLAQEHSVSTSLSSSTQPPCAQRTRTICGRAAAKKLVGAPDLDRRAAHRSCTAGEPGTTFFRRTCRRQCPPVRRSHSVRADVATISQLALLASLYVAISTTSLCFCGNTSLFMSPLSASTK